MRVTVIHQHHSKLKKVAERIPYNMIRLNLFRFRGPEMVGVTVLMKKLYSCRKGNTELLIHTNIETLTIYTKRERLAKNSP